MDMNSFLWVIFGMTLIPSLKCIFGLYDRK